MSYLAEATAAACVEKINEGQSLYDVWTLTNVFPVVDALQSRRVVANCIAGLCEAWEGSRGAPPRITGHPAAIGIANAPPALRRLYLAGLVSLRADKDTDAIIECLADGLRRLSLQAPFSSNMPAPAKAAPEPQPVIVQVTNQMPAQPAPVVNVANQMPAQPPPMVNVTNQMPDNMTVSITGLPDRVTETSVTRDRDGNIKETVQIESDG